MIKAIIFDMDGVIVDSETYQFEAFRKLFSKYGIHLTKDNFAWIGKTAKENIEDTIKKYNIKEDSNVLVKLREEIYINLIKNNIKPMNGAIGLINALSKKYTLALASSSIMRNIETILSGLHIKTKFKIIVSGDQVKQGKPNPEIFLKVLEKLHLKPTECLVIEDAKTGVEAAKNAGMKCIGYRNVTSGNQDLSKADLVIDDFSKFNIDEFATNCI